MPDLWERYRQLIWDEHQAHRAGFAKRARARPVDPEVRAAAAVLFERLKALTRRSGQEPGTGIWQVRSSSYCGIMRRSGTGGALGAAATGRICSAGAAI